MEQLCLRDAKVVHHVFDDVAFTSLQYLKNNPMHKLYILNIAEYRRISNLIYIHNQKKLPSMRFLSSDTSHCQSLLSWGFDE